jgi:hypothetical protein
VKTIPRGAAAKAADAIRQTVIAGRSRATQSATPNELHSRADELFLTRLVIYDLLDCSGDPARNPTRKLSGRHLF